MRDNGPGFDPEALERAFEPFYTTKGREGSGLGLSMAYGFASGAGGDLTIRSAPGAGAAVTLTLPLGAPDAVDEIAPGPTLEAGPAPDAARGIALVADDDADLRRILRETLRAAGWPVIEAADADITVEPGRVTVYVSSDQAQALGVDLAERLTAARPGLRVLLATGLPPEAAERRRAQGRFPLIAKPFAPEALRDLIERIEDGAP